MIDAFEDIFIMDSDHYQDYENKHVENIKDLIELNDHILVKARSKQADINTMLDNASESYNVNIAIASSITAYARILRTQYKNNTNFELFYTDSIFINKPLDDSLISNTELG